MRISIIFKNGNGKCVRTEGFPVPGSTEIVEECHNFGSYKEGKSDFLMTICYKNSEEQLVTVDSTILPLERFGDLDLVTIDGNVMYDSSAVEEGGNLEYEAQDGFYEDVLSDLSDI
jgi:hypothetical protein